MIELIIKRCLASIPLLFLLSLITFSLLKALPGDPIEVFIGGAEKDLTKQEKQALRQEMGLDKSMPEQYLSWLKALARGDLGRSYRDGRPVGELIAERLPATISLIAAALTLALVAGLAWGATLTWLTMTKSFLILERLLHALAYALYCMPSFWLGFLLIAAFAQSGLSSIHLLGLHPAGATGICLGSLILPALVLASRRAAKLALILNSSMIEEAQNDYVFAARAKGLSKQAVLIKHIGKNSLVPVVSLLGLSIPALIGGSVLVETVFAWPGMGRLAVDATFGRNYPILLSLTIIYGSFVILGNLLSDIIQSTIDPRLKEKLEEQRPRQGLSTT